MTTVGLNVLWLVPGVVGGSEESTTGTLRAIAAAAHDDLRFVLFATDSFARAHPDLVTSLETVTAPEIPGGRAGRIALESTWLAAHARRAGVELMHHLGGTAPPIRTSPVVLTVHDLQPLDLPQNFSTSRVAYLRIALPRSVRAAELVLTPSEFVRRSVIARFGVDPARVETVHHGADIPESFESLETVRRSVGHDRWFVLPAITYAHKNHRVVIDAFARLAADHPGVALVLTGARGPVDDEVTAQIASLGLAGRVVRTGRISRAHLQGLVHHAAGVVFPSRYEGFGLPALEAMAWGAPLLAADTTALPEVVGDGGQLLDPDDPTPWSDAMRLLLDEPAERARWAAAGRARAAEYSWNAAGSRVVEVYRRVVAGSRNGGTRR